MIARASATTWPKGIARWIEGRTLFASVPFTWNLPEVCRLAMQRDMTYDRIIVGGPGVKLMPDYLAGLPNLTIGGDMPGVLQRVNPQATRTTTGCIRRCGFCAVPSIEGDFRELDDWPDLPIICDNNLLAASDAHFNRVIDRLVVHGWADFNQGLDARLLTPKRARRIAEIGKPMVRLALDDMRYSETWEAALEMLLCAGIAKSRVRSYALVGFDDGPAEAWRRCEWIEERGVMVLPMWFHRLDGLQANVVTPEQTTLGWNDFERRRLMQWFYQHKEAVA